MFVATAPDLFPSNFSFSNIGQTYTYMSVCAYKYTSTFQSGGDTYIPVAPASLTDTSIEMSTTEVMFLIWILAVVDQVEPWQ